MKKYLAGEKWKTVKFNFRFTNDFLLEVSDKGRLRTFNKISDGNIINGSMINGYRIIRLKLYKPRDYKTKTTLDSLQQKVHRAEKKLKSLHKQKAGKRVIRERAEQLRIMKSNLSKNFQDDLKKRTIHFHSLVHRLVADYFLKKPTTRQTVVAHLDFNKLNNNAGNLKWMTPEENYKHQKHSPFVIKEKKERRNRRNENSGSTKLTVQKVMQLKKLFKQDFTLKQLAKQFKVSDMQILRIKRGENWGDIKAAG